MQEEINELKRQNEMLKKKRFNVSEKILVYQHCDFNHPPNFIFHCIGF